MYTLRVKTERALQNIALGESYSVSYPGSPVFEMEYKQLEGSIKDELKCVLHGESGLCFLIVSSGEYYIMTDSGKTFEKL